MTKDTTIEEDEIYIFKNKIYNITKSELIYEFEEAVKTNMMVMGRHMKVEERRQMYKSIKGNYFIKVFKGGRFYMKDISKEDLSFLKVLQAELINQETDCQAAPRFWVLRQYEYEPTGEDWMDKYAYVETEEYMEFEDTEDLVQYLIDYELALEEEIRDIEDYDLDEAFEYVLENLNDDNNFERIPSKRVARIMENTLFLTKKAAKEHMKANKHHYNDTVHTYAMTAWRSPEIESLFKIIEDIDLDKLEEMI